MTTDHTTFLSTAAVDMKESAIRRMGAVLAAGQDLISFAPGYPDPTTFPWAEFGAHPADRGLAHVLRRARQELGVIGGHASRMSGISFGGAAEWYQR